jgi:hypothetical protein
MYLINVSNGVQNSSRQEINIKLKILPVWNKEELPEQWMESIILPIYKKDDKTNCIKEYYCYQLQWNSHVRLVLGMIFVP